jgi:hypothetical protein
MLLGLDEEEAFRLAVHVSELQELTEWQRLVVQLREFSLA